MNQKINNIISIPKSGKSTVIGIMSKIGSRYESNDIKGISHFIEHMCFKGSKKYTAKQINSGIEQYGGILNAYTSNEVTCYWAIISNKYKDIAKDILIDMASNPMFPIKEVNKEREVILQELKMYQDNPKDSLEILRSQYLFKPESPLGIFTIGIEKSLYNIDRNKLINFHKENCNNLYLIQIGDVPEILYNVDNTNLDDIRPTEDIEILTNHAPGTQILLPRKDIQQANVEICNYVLLNQDRIFTNYSFSLLAEIYNGMIGRLFNIIREKYHMVYRISFNVETYRNGGFVWSVNLGLDPKNINKAYDLIMTELTRPLIKKEIEIGIQSFIGSRDMYLDKNFGIMQEIVECIGTNLFFPDFIYNYEHYIRLSEKHINEFIEQINFKKNILIGNVPEK